MTWSGGVGFAMEGGISRFLIFFGEFWVLGVGWWEENGKGAKGREMLREMGDVGLYIGKSRMKYTYHVQYFYLLRYRVTYYIPTTHK